MATFAGQAAKQGQGCAYWLDVSLDKFATVAYRWGTVGGLLDGANVYEDRIARLGNYSKGFSPDHVAGAATVEVTLHNIDRAVDWMVDQATSYQVFYARARLYVGLYDKDAIAAPANLVSKQLGEFVISYFPERDDSTVKFTLSDDLLGILGQPVGAPTMDDWINSGDATCPMLAGTFLINRYEMLPLIFGSDWAEARQAGDNPNSTNQGLVVCVTTETGLNAAVSWNEANMQLGVKFNQTVQSVVYGSGGQITGWAPPTKFLSVPTTFSLYGVTYTNWTAKVSAVISKGGKNYLILWVELQTDNFYKWAKGIAGINYNPAGSATTATKDALFKIISAWYVRDAPGVSQGIKLSGRTQFAAKTHTADVIQDLVTYYSSDGNAGYVDIASFDRARKEMPWGQAAGVVHPGLDQTPEQRASGAAAPTRTTLREHVTGICQAADLDIFITWSGTIAVSSLWNDYDVSIYASLLTPLFSIAEERSGGQIDGTPSNGDRWAPYNRILLSDIKTDLETDGLLTSPGPYDNPDTSAPDWKVKLETVWRLGWTPRSMQGGNPWYARRAEQRVRPRFSFVTDIEAVAKLDLGSFFLANWSRNFTSPAPFGSTVFQVESISIKPADNSVDIAAIWRHETTTDLPYILDDETLLARATGSAGRTATVTDTSATVLFSSGSLVADGVAVNDSLILKDANEATDTFKRNKVLKITAITDATHLTVSDPIDALDFGAPAGAAVSSWEIRKSERTYPTAGSDPANYPDGGTMYGKVSDLMTSGSYSDAVNGNKLISG